MKLDIDTSWFASPETPLPEVWTVRQNAEAPTVGNLEAATVVALKPLLEDRRIAPGASVAVGVGSRGIDNLVVVVRTVIQELKRRGCQPFIVPAMGSHGGATAEGQTAMLRGYGITEEAVGAPIRATMEVGQVGALENGYPVYFDCNALGADAVLVVNRVKPHTDFMADIESGPSKMCAIGLGKQKGASTIHRYGADGLRSIMPAVARVLVGRTNIVGGLALIENPYGRTAEIHALCAADFTKEPEQQLLKRSRELSPKLPFDEIDVLVVDLMGKDISGSGMDTHVLGRARMPSIREEEWDGPHTRIVCVLDLTEPSHGNAAGLGLADMTTRRLIERMNFAATFINHRTSGEGGVERGRLPIILEDAEQCVKSAMALCGQGDLEKVRLVHIRDTEHLEAFEVSAALRAEVSGRDGLELDAEPHPLNLRQPLELGGRA